MQMNEREAMELPEGLNARNSAEPDNTSKNRQAPGEIMCTYVCQLHAAKLGRGHFVWTGRLQLWWSCIRMSHGCINTYWPVSLTCISCKRLGKLVGLHKCENLGANILVCRTQHGFWKRRLWLSKPSSFLDGVAAKMEGGKSVEICYLDFFQAATFKWAKFWNN